MEFGEELSEAGSLQELKESGSAPQPNIFFDREKEVQTRDHEKGQIKFNRSYLYLLHYKNLSFGNTLFPNYWKEETSI